jgi:hypothetical protein
MHGAVQHMFLALARMHRRLSTRGEAESDMSCSCFVPSAEMPRGSASARGGALPPHATKVVMQMFHARYPVIPNVFTAISNASKQAGTQLSSKLQHCSASCGVWCKAVLVQYPLHKLPVPSVLKVRALWSVGRVLLVLGKEVLHHVQAATPQTDGRNKWMQQGTRLVGTGGLL